LWEVHYDPYDVSHVWVRNHHAGGWITAPWTHLHMLRQPFADFTWRRARQLAADDHDETAITRALADLLQRAGAGPDRVQRIAARTRVAAATSLRPPSEPEPESEGKAAVRDDAHSQSQVVPLGVFDPLGEGDW
jgi:putative transposase